MGFLGRGAPFHAALYIDEVGGGGYAGQEVELLKEIMARTKKKKKNSTANIGFEEKLSRLVAELNAQFAESSKLEKAINAILRELVYA